MLVGLLFMSIPQLGESTEDRFRRTAILSIVPEESHRKDTTQGL